MEPLLQKDIDGLNLDRSNWQLVKFGDVAVQQKQKVDRENTGLTRYVKGEHMLSEDLHLREWGDLIDEYLGPAFIRKFEEGDILYGSRRTYLRKTTIAPFDGITSNTTFVIKANEKKINRRLLPFVMMSEGFTQHSIRNSKGSVNPYVNWKDLSGYEFLLPSEEQQAELAELLWANDKLLESQLSLLEASQLFFNVEKSNVVLQGKGNQIEYSEVIKNKKAKNWVATSIGELLKEKYLVQIQDGNHGELHPKSSDYIYDGVPFIMANTLNDGEVDFLGCKKLPQALTDTLRIGFSIPGDILLSHKGTVGEVAIVPDDIEWPYLMLSPQVTYYRVNAEKLSAKFLFFVLTSGYFQQQLKRISFQSTRAYVGITAQKNLKVVIPKTKNDQNQVVQLLLSTRKTISGIKEAIGVTKLLRKQLINQVFEA